MLAQEAQRSEVDGVICGHIHHAAMEDIRGISYMNTGDWVESCTALAENFDGSFEIITWAQILEVEPAVAASQERAVVAAFQGDRIKAA